MFTPASNNPFAERNPSDPDNRFRYPDIQSFDQATGGTPGGYGGGSQFGGGYGGQQLQQQQGFTGYDGSSGGYGGGYGAGGYGGGGSAFGGIAAQPTGFYGQQAQQQQQQQPSQFQQPFASTSGYGGGSQMYPQQTGFYGQPQSPSFGQQPQTFQQQQQYGYPSQQQQQYPGVPYQGADYGGGMQGYGFQQQQQPQQQQSGPYLNLSEFDPLIGTAAANATSQGGGVDSLGTGPTGTLHPLKYIYANKSDLEKWNNASWAGAVQAFVALQSAWEGHRQRCTDAQLQPYVSMVQTQRLKELQRTAEQNIDTVAAATLQLSEVKDRYRSSMDFSGRDQVRQALNAALKNLPSWPPNAHEPLM